MDGWMDSKWPGKQFSVGLQFSGKEMEILKKKSSSTPKGDEKVLGVGCCVPAQKFMGFCGHPKIIIILILILI